MMRLALVVVPALVLASVPAGDARADTLGLLRTTPIAEEATIAKPAGSPRVVVARTAAEWAAAWKAAGGPGPPRAVDFDRQMIVGVVNGPKLDRVIYRIQLDDAARPRALEVHLGAGGDPTWSGRTREATGAHFVVTPRSALAVRFVTDAMVDAGLFAHTNTGEGVESTEVAVVPGATLATTGRASLREQAERAVVAALTAAERTQLLAGPLRGPLRRIPHGWTSLDVVRGRDGWTITYDKLVFAVDARTGAVSRPKP